MVSPGENIKTPISLTLFLSRRTVLDALPPQQNTGAPAPAPAPVAPHGPNALMPGAQNQPQRGVNNPLGNPLGLIGRLFGPPAQPPAVPARFMPPQIQNNVPPNARNLPEVIIQYHIQYQPQLQQQQQNPQQPLQPAPPFNGFTGPGGTWQPWPANRDGMQNGVARGGPNTVPTPTINPQEPTTSSVEPASASSDPDPNVSQMTPREAAALAALRRMNSTENMTSSAPGTSEPATSTRSEDEATPMTASNNPPGVPSLIPLYDYSTIRLSPIDYPTFTTPMDRRAPVTSTNIPTPRHRQDARSQLPPILTDEQLAIMDRLTREAIDERLRVLEGVSGAVYSCIDDLMRMRSALPTSIPTTTTSVNLERPKSREEGEPQVSAPNPSVWKGKEPVRKGESSTSSSGDHNVGEGAE